MSPKNILRTQNQGKESKRKVSWTIFKVLTALEEQGSDRINKLDIRSFYCPEMFYDLLH